MGIIVLPAFAADASGGSKRRERERSAYAVAFVRASGHHQADAAAHLLSPQ